MNEHNPDDRSEARELRRDEREAARARHSADEQAAREARERRVREERETARIIALDDALQDQEAASDAPGAAGERDAQLRAQAEAREAERIRQLEDDERQGAQQHSGPARRQPLPEDVPLNRHTEDETIGLFGARKKSFSSEYHLTRRSKVKRLHQIGKIAVQFDALKGLTPVKMRLMFEALGPTFVKVGQILSMRSEILPQPFCDELAKLRADADPMPYSIVLETLENEYRRPVDEIFATIDSTPLGSASLAQVHRATLLTGEDVAVKVQRPGVRETMAEDVSIMRSLARGATKIMHNAQVVDFQGVVEELWDTFDEETNFLNEARNLCEFKRFCEHYAYMDCPTPYVDLCTEHVVVMEYIEGIPIAHTRELLDDGYSLKEIGTKLVDNYASQILDAGFFHADPHPGNILVRDGEIVWIDLGMTGSLTASQRMLVGRMFRAVATNNAYDLKEAVLGLSTVRGEVDHGALLSQMSSLLEEYGTADLSDINMGAVFQELVEVLRTQNLIMAPSVTMLARGVVTLEGVMAAIDPDANVVQIVSKHVVRQSLSPHHIEERVVSLLTASAESAEAMTRLPRQVSNAVEMLNRGELSVTADMKVPANALATLYAVCGRIALAMISAGLFMGSSILCTTNMEPRILEVPVLGALGYLGALVLGVYVIYRTLASRHRMRNDEELR